MDTFRTEQSSSTIPLTFRMPVVSESSCSPSEKKNHRNRRPTSVCWELNCLRSRERRRDSPLTPPGGTTMADRGLTEALTSDHHFEQAGFFKRLEFFQAT
jgi:hypothetical protein